MGSKMMNLVDRQRKAYNNQDLEGFLECYSDDIQVFMLQNDQKLTNSKTELATTMKTAFDSNPESNAQLVTRIEQGNLIVDQERITGHSGITEIRSISIYEITDNKISKLWFAGRTVS